MSADGGQTSALEGTGLSARERFLAGEISEEEYLAEAAHNQVKAPVPFKGTASD
jgi:uncharacterized membrane protein